MFPQLAHMIAKDSSLKESLTLCDQSALEPLKDTIEFLYTLTENYYYNYKQSESERRFLDLSDEGISKSFLNISLGDDNEFVKKDDVGRVPFLTAPDSLMPVLNKCKEDYHSLIDYEFILAPVSEEGGYAYMCPTSGLAINKDSFNRDWSLEFLNFIFTSKYNKLFAKGFNCTPNTKDALKVISKKYAIPESKIGQPADVTFEQYNFFNMINPVLIATTKANNPKYMELQEDGTKKMYASSYYVQLLSDALRKQKESLSKE